jgi:hypothetical protein
VEVIKHGSIGINTFDAGTSSNLEKYASMVEGSRAAHVTTRDTQKITLNLDSADRKSLLSISVATKYIDVIAV